MRSRLYLNVVGSLAVLLGILLSLLVPMISLWPGSDLAAHLATLQVAGAIASFVGSAFCVAGYLLVNEQGAWSWVGRAALVATGLYFIQSFVRVAPPDFLGEVPLLPQQVLAGVELVAILAFLVRSFLRRTEAFQFSFSFWLTMDFLLELVLLPFWGTKHPIFVFAGLLLLVDNFVLFVVALRYSTRRLRQGREGVGTS